MLMCFNSFVTIPLLVITSALQNKLHGHIHTQALCAHMHICVDLKAF